MMYWIGLLDTLTSVILVIAVLELPFAIFVMKGFFYAVPWDIEMSAMTDGASRRQAFRMVVLPQVKIGRLAICVFSFLRGWEEYVFVRTLVMQKENWTMSLYLFWMRDDVMGTDYASGPTSPDAFRRAWNTMSCLDQIEVVRPPRDVPAPSGRARIVFWNAERLRYPEPSTSLLERAGADAVLLCEVDLGMARSGKRHTTNEAAAAPGAGHVFAVEFVELDLGDARASAVGIGARRPKLACTARPSSRRTCFTDRHWRGSRPPGAGSTAASASDG